MVCAECGFNPCKCNSNPGGRGSSGISSFQLAKNLFRNSNLSNANLQLLERALEKIIADCMGGKLYDKLIEKLNGGTLIIEMDPNTYESEFSYTPGKSNAKITWGIKDNAGSSSLVHELTHVLQAYGEGYDPYSLNNEVEARWAQYNYLRRNVSPDSKLLDEYSPGKLGSLLSNFDIFIDSNGNYKYFPSISQAGVQNIAEFMGKALKEAKDKDDKKPYSTCNWNDNIQGMDNFKNIKPLLKDC